MKKLLFFAIAASGVYFLAGLFTINDYGISWDEPTHFKRGQAYLWYFETKDWHYTGLPAYNLDEARKDKNYHLRSLYQNDSQDGRFWLNNDGGHPPLNGILSSLFNQIFYQKLGISGDVQSYHLLEILVSSILIGVVFLFGAEAFNIWVGLFAAIFTATYPLFWAESHFNIKDPIETTFIALSIYLIWRSYAKGEVKWLWWSAVSSGVALGTKFNILFLPFIIGPWLLAQFLVGKKNIVKWLKDKKVIIAAVLFPIIMYSIFFATWPFIWQNPLHNTLGVLKYYKDIGTGDTFQSGLEVSGWNTYPLKWILFTTPPLLLLFTLVGLLNKKLDYWKGKSVLILWAVWLVVPILRVSIPKSIIYGGDRQIMEFIPAMSLIAGVGLYRFSAVIPWLKKNYAQAVFAGALLLLSLNILVKFHPNENVYFNFLSGGLKKQVDKGLPAAGNSFGNAYLQGVNWINRNVPPYSQVALIQGTIVNVPAYEFRPDIHYSNADWSGIDRKGEYLMELTYNYEVKVYNYAWDYAENMLDPVYEDKVDGVPILTIWKNDLVHTKPEFRKSEQIFTGPISSKVDGQDLTISLPDPQILSRVAVNYAPDDCQSVKGGSVETSLDSKNWSKEKDPLAFVQSAQVLPVRDNTLTYFFAGIRAQYIKMTAYGGGSCLLNQPKVELKVLQ